MPCPETRNVRVPEGWLRIEGVEPDQLPDSLLLDLWHGAAEGWEPVPSSSSATVLKGKLLGGTEAYFKRFHLRDSRDRFKHLIRPSRATRAAMKSRQMSGDGFKTPAVLGVFTLRRHGLVAGSALITTAVADATPLKELIQARDRQGRRALLAAFAEELARLHQAGWHHADLRAGNVLAYERGSAWDFHYLDNEGNRKGKSLPDQDAVHNLMQVNMEVGPANGERRIFWQRYRERRQLDKERADAICRDVRAWTLRRWTKHGLKKQLR